jgi:hypothetical protein
MDSAKWHKLSTVSQLANIGAEVGRTVSWKQNTRFGNYLEPFYRALEYIDLSIVDTKNAGPKCKEICRLRETLVDWHFGSHLYHSTDASWNKYFYPFAIYSNLHK